MTGEIDHEARGGVATEESQTFEYTVRKEFSATFSCERENANAPCLPFGRNSASFT